LNPRNYTGAILRWIPAILWAAVILGASTDTFSAGHSGEWLSSFIIRIVGHPLAPRRFDILHKIVRKCAHLLEYGILGALLFRAVRGEEGGFRARWAVVSVALALCVAATDEWHQFFIPSRTPSAWDVLLDCAGAGIAQLLWRYNSRS